MFFQFAMTADYKILTHKLPIWRHMIPKYAGWKYIESTVRNIHHSHVLYIHLIVSFALPWHMNAPKLDEKTSQFGKVGSSKEHVNTASREMCVTSYTAASNELSWMFFV